MSEVRRRKFDKEFKLEAVRLVVEEGRPVAEVSRGLGIHENLLHVWKRRYKEDMSDPFPGKGRLRPVDDELRRLKKELEDVKQERDILKKAFGHFLEGTQMKYRFIEENRSGFVVEKMCLALKVSKSGYYAWKGRGKSRRELENEKLDQVIRKAHRRSRERYGSPRIAKELEARGVNCSENRVARRMRLSGIVAKTRRRFKVTTRSKHNHPVAYNLINQNFNTERPDQKWVSDITYVWTREGWLYLAVILDLFSRQVVGWSMSHSLSQELVLKAFRQALWRRSPGAGVIFHSDQGVQYACQAFRDMLKEHKFVQSMSGKGNCYDNAVAESFFHTLKTELVYFESYQTRDEARKSIFEYIEIFYNRQRRHSTLGYLSPVNFELLHRAA
ncbi:MAG: IS3 family transposase [Candidatus Scalindua sp.]